MKSMFRCLCAAAFCGALAPALAVEVGPYATVALGQSAYDADCGYVFSNCDGGHGTSGKVGLGYQFGVFGLEGWLIDYGKSPLLSGDHVRLDSVGVGAAWRWQWGASVQGVLRAGVASVHQARVAENFRSVEGTFGLGVSLDLVPNVAMELAWDLVNSTGGSSQIGTVTARSTTLGLRVRF